MAQYQVTLDGDVLHGLFQRDEGVARLLEQVLNQIPQAHRTITSWSLRAI